MRVHVPDGGGVEAGVVERELHARGSTRATIDALWLAVALSVLVIFPFLRSWKATAISAIATAGPALGGQPFAENVQNLFGLQSDSYVWRILCLVALLVSVSGAVLTNISKSQDDVGRLGAAEGGGRG